MEEEKHGNSVSIQTFYFLGGAMPVGTPMPYRGKEYEDFFM